MRRITWLTPVAIVAFAACSGGDTGGEAPDGAAANPCAANPCSANPCAAVIPAEKIMQAGRELNSAGMSDMQLAARGAELWADASLSGGNDTSCSTCHAGDGTALMNATFAEPYPHPVAMASERLLVDEVTAAEMVQLCMAVPMNAEPLDYASVELAALTAYVLELQKGFNASAAGMNPCAANPCAANPCGG